jgi:hypothetical protein
MLNTSTSDSATENAGNAELLTIQDAEEYRNPLHITCIMLFRDLSPLFYTPLQLQRNHKRKITAAITF